MTTMFRAAALIFVLCLHYCIDNVFAQLPCGDNSDWPKLTHDWLPYYHKPEQPVLAPYVPIFHQPIFIVFPVPYAMSQHPQGPQYPPVEQQSMTNDNKPENGPTSQYHPQPSSGPTQEVPNNGYRLPQSRMTTGNDDTIELSEKSEERTEPTISETSSADLLPRMGDETDSSNPTTIAENGESTIVNVELTTVSTEEKNMMRYQNDEADNITEPPEDLVTEMEGHSPSTDVSVGTTQPSTKGFAASRSFHKHQPSYEDYDESEERESSEKRKRKCPTKEDIQKIINHWMKVNYKKIVKGLKKATSE